jgi:arylsulfatase
MAEVFAGFSEYTDAQVGRIVDYLEQTGQLDNTVIFYCADNGASGEGSPNGSVNENKFFNGYPDELAENMKYLDTLGSPDTYNHYPTGWAVAFSTPFQMFKRYSQFSGGTCDPMVIHWPAGIKAKGQVRHQYHHATDVAATILDVTGLQMPATYRGVEQHPLDGVSMRYSFDAADAPTTKKRQYYAMLGTRGIWEDGWKAAALHAPISGQGHFDQDRWELYHVDEDRSESKNLAAEHPEKLQALIDARRPHRDRITHHRAAAVRAAPQPLRLLPWHGAGGRGGGRQHPRPVLQDHRRCRYHRRRPGRDLRPRFPIRRPRAVPQRPQAALCVQLPRHQTRAGIPL